MAARGLHVAVGVRGQGECANRGERGLSGGRAPAGALRREKLKGSAGRKLKRSISGRVR